LDRTIHISVLSWKYWIVRSILSPILEIVDRTILNLLITFFNGGPGGRRAGGMAGGRAGSGVGGPGRRSHRGVRGAESPGGRAGGSAGGHPCSASCFFSLLF